MHRYNKPEGLQAWIQREKLSPESIVFVDDNSDNVFSMFLFFASLEKRLVADEANADVKFGISVWYPPEDSDFEENYDVQTRELVLNLSRDRAASKHSSM